MVFRLRDTGVKSVRSRSTGDLYCKAVVETPVNLTPEQRELLDKFEATFVGDGARRHSPKSCTFFDRVKGFWQRMVSYSAYLQEWRTQIVFPTSPPHSGAQRKRELEVK